MPSASIPAAIIGTDVAASAGAATAATAATAAGTAAAVGGTTASYLSTAGLIASGVSGVVGAIGAEEQASATAKTAAYQAQVAQNSQQIALTKAQQSEAQGEAGVEQQGLKTKAEIGSIEAAQAASNIDVNQGSAVDVRSSAAALGQLNALNTQATAQQQAYGYMTAATSFQGQAGLEQMEASQAPVAGAIGAGSSLLSGATGVSTQYSNWLRAAGSSASGNGPPAIFS